MERQDSGRTGSVDGISHVLLVGEDNPYGQDPRFALYHKPRHASGNRLRQHLGLRDATYEKLQKINLCGGKWSAKEARWRAAEINGRAPVTCEYAAFLDDLRVIVLLGAKVREAFGLRTEFFGITGATTANLVYVVLPHPSGLNRAWNRPGAREDARRLLRHAAPEVPWGEIG